MRHGWFVIPGVQRGDRTLEEQRIGVEYALAECRDKTVLDLGCAEALLSREFAMYGARSVLGIDSLSEHLLVAANICSRYNNCKFLQADLNDPPELAQTFDIVLALGIAHKLTDPAAGIRYAAAHCKDLMLVRLTRYAPKLLRGKFPPNNVCDVPEEMSDAGFVLERLAPGPREETVHYYRRKK